MLYYTKEFSLQSLDKYDDVRLYSNKALKIAPNLNELLSKKELTAFDKVMNNNTTKDKSFVFTLYWLSYFCRFALFFHNMSIYQLPGKITFNI